MVYFHILLLLLLPVLVVEFFVVQVFRCSGVQVWSFWSKNDKLNLLWFFFFAFVNADVGSSHQFLDRKISIFKLEMFCKFFTTILIIRLQPSGEAEESRLVRNYSTRTCTRNRTTDDVSKSSDYPIVRFNPLNRVCFHEKRTRLTYTTTRYTSTKYYY
jgi:hypothetical protein